MGNRLNLTVGQVQPERTVQGKTGDFPVLDFLATNPEGKQFKYGMSKKELFQYVKTGVVIDAEITETPSKQTNPETGQPYINRNVVQVFVNGKPVIEQKGFQKGGYQREDPTLRRRSYALSYAKDLCVAGKIELTLIIPTAEVFDKWLSTVPSSTSEKAATPSPKAESPSDSHAGEESKPPVEDNPLLIEALKCKTGAALASFAGKHGYSLEKFVKLVGCNPVDVKNVEAAAKVLFGK